MLALASPLSRKHSSLTELPKIMLKLQRSDIQVCKANKTTNFVRPFKNYSQTIHYNYNNEITFPSDIHAHFVRTYYIYLKLTIQ